MKTFGSVASASGTPPRPPVAFDRADRSSVPPSTDSPMSCRSHISSSCAMFFIANASPTTPSRRSSPANGSDAMTPAGIVSQYDDVCICCSGRSSSPEPTFSFV